MMFQEGRMAASHADLIEGPVEISSGTEIQGRAVIVGSVQIGKNNRIGHGTVIVSFPQDLSFNPTANSA
jgi:acyl-[acyl carrier protein]--UDP-N-acetylglucosamine O-acyltransferase